MKNVAGYDVSRLLAGSLGMLGVIVEVSLKVLPVAPADGDAALRAASQAEALARLNAWGGRPLPLDASAWWNGTLVVRLRGAQRGGRGGAARARRRASSSRGSRPPFWQGLRDQSDEFFVAARRAIGGAGRAAVAAVAAADRAAAGAGRRAADRMGRRAALAVPTALPAAQVREAAAAAGGHATLFRAQRQVGRRVRAACRAARAHPPRAQARLRSGRRLQPRPPLSGALTAERRDAFPARATHPSMQTALAPEFQAHARRQRSRGHPAQVRALRLLHRDLPDLPAARRRARRAARPHLPDQAGARGRARRRAATQLHLDRCLTCRNCETHLPVGRAVRQPGRDRPRDRRAHACSGRPASAPRAWRSRRA